MHKRLNSRTGLLLAVAMMVGCSDSNNGGLAPFPVIPDFSAADASLEAFVAQQPAFSGASLIIVDKRAGVVHRRLVGDHTDDTVILLASTSKVPAASLLMALAEDDDNVDFEIDRVIDDYLPYTGVWPGRTTEQLLSNTSGIPGLGQISGYGDHLCQYVPVGQLQDCGQIIYQTPLPDLVSTPPGTNFDYGGSQWQLAGTVAEIVGGGTWNQLFDQYIGQPCGLEVFAFGNNLATSAEWTGDPSALVGLENPNIEGGAMSNIDDYARILDLHLNDGLCGENRVLSPEAVAFMRIDRATPTGSVDEGGSGYGMGWWIPPPAAGATEASLFIDPGAFGAVAWIDTERGYGALLAVQSPTLAEGSIGSGYASSQLIPLVTEAFDAARQ
ncbi:MAG: beta-lactamase family protein [Gammaproteobacteria bacterium]|nr:beta-lactamase family protein [Gammaproteobacteria bacterium]